MEYAPVIFVLVMVALIVGILISTQRASAAKKKADEERRRIGIYAKYGRTDIAERILKGNAWVGQTADQLTDAIGSPVDIDQKVLKTKSKEIWKYAHKGGNRYGLRITLENGTVVGWDEKL